MRCGTEFTLKEGDKIICPNCGELPFKCWHCKEWISGIVKECKVCSPKFMICNNCGSCSEDCLLEEHTINLQKRFFSTENIEISRKVARDIAEYFAQLNRGLVRKECPRKVSISYAKGKNKSMAIRLQGVKIKNGNDHSAFMNRMSIINESEIGTEWTVDSIREDGSNGHEYRECFNILLCLGEIEKFKKKNKQGIYYEVWRRVSKEPCPRCNWNKLIEYRCPRSSCNKILEKGMQCICTYEKGKNKGEKPLAKAFKTKINFCNLPRKEFKDKGYIDDEKEGDYS